MSDSDINWHKEQIEAYRLEYPRYERYAELLSRILGDGVAAYVRHPIIESRAKAVDSFAEKAVRKKAAYSDPVAQFTDLCGARVVLSTQKEVDLVCEYVKTRFRVDEANSQNTFERLKADSFGYLSVHFIVQLDYDKDKSLTKEDRELIGDRKAEIQVRTLLQHAWADIGHDRIYKSAFGVPAEWQRDVARVAASLEIADEEFQRLVDNTTEFCRYAKVLSPEEFESERAVLDTVLSSESDGRRVQGHALRLALLYSSQRRWDEVKRVLSGHLDGTSVTAWEARMAYGRAVCDTSTVGSAEREDGLKMLKRVASEDDLGEPPDPDKIRIRSSALFFLAEYMRENPAAAAKALKLYAAGHKLNPSDPFCLSGHLEFRIHAYRSRDFVPLVQPQLAAGIARCRELVRLGLEQPEAQFTAGRFRVLLEEASAAFGSYCEAIDFIRSSIQSVSEAADVAREVGNAARLLNRERQFLRNISYPNEPEGLAGDIDALLEFAEEFIGLGQPANEPERKALVLVGPGEPEGRTDGYFAVNCLSEVFRSYRGDVVTFGEPIPVSWALTSVIQANPAKRDEIRLRRYTSSQPGGQITVSSILAYWRELFSAGFMPAGVVVFGLGGGDADLQQLRLALALGAPVGVLTDGQNAAASLVKDPDWAHHPRLMPMPKDAAAWVAFGNLEARAKLDSELADLPKIVHEEFLQQNRNAADPARQPWEGLREDLKESNRGQVAAAQFILGRAGFELRKTSGDSDLITFTREEVDDMARVEHGRWTVERLRSGWRSGERDVARRRTPYLIPWDQLPDDIKQHDRDAIVRYPGLFAKVGYGIYRRNA